MKSNIILLFLLSILWVSCVSRKSQTVSIPHLTTLSADSITIPPVLLAVTRLFIVHICWLLTNNGKIPYSLSGNCQNANICLMRG